MSEKNKIEEIHRKVFGNEKEYNVIDVYHYLMVAYGYMSFEEFKKMDANLVNELVTRINDNNKKQNAGSGGGRR